MFFIGAAGSILSNFILCDTQFTQFSMLVLAALSKNSFFLVVFLNEFLLSHILRCCESATHKFASSRNYICLKYSLQSEKIKIGSKFATPQITLWHISQLIPFEKVSLFLHPFQLDLLVYHLKLFSFHGLDYTVVCK